MVERIAILGAGHLGGFLAEGLLSAGHPREAIVLSPRGRSVEIGRRLDLSIAPDNAALVRFADVVVLSVRTEQARGALGGLPLAEHHLVVSCCARLALDQLRRLARPAAAVRAMPQAAVAVRESPTVLFPEEARARALLEPLGPVLALAEEEDFERAAAAGATYGLAHALVGATVEWASAAGGLPPGEARKLAACALTAAGRMILERPDTSIGDLLKTAATPGSATTAGLGSLAASGVLEAWRSALDAALERAGRRVDGASGASAGPAVDAASRPPAAAVVEPAPNAPR